MYWVALDTQNYLSAQGDQKFIVNKQKYITKLSLNHEDLKLVSHWSKILSFN